MATETKGWTSYPLGPTYKHGENPERDRLIDMLVIEFSGGYVTHQEARDWVEDNGLVGITRNELYYAVDRGQHRWQYGPAQPERVYWENNRALKQLAATRAE
jgi:hypothetical protein